MICSMGYWEWDSLKHEALIKDTRQLRRDSSPSNTGAIDENERIHLGAEREK